MNHPSPAQLLRSNCPLLPELMAAHARQTPERLALSVDGISLSYQALQQRIDQVAAALQTLGVGPGQRVATLGDTSHAQLVVMLGALRAGAAYAPLPGHATPEQLQRMISDAQATCLFAAPDQQTRLGPLPGQTVLPLTDTDLDKWLASASAADQPAPVAIGADSPFNIIYSSGTTGTPKGIVQPHSLRSAQVLRGQANGFDADAVALLATPLCSNTTLTLLMTTLGLGGHALLMSKFDAATYLDTAERWGVTHTILVPVQYTRLLAHPSFDQRDLSRYRIKINTGAPMPVVVKQELLRRWPGALHDYYGLTEGGVFCLLDATAHPDKLHTVGKPPAGYEVRIVNPQGEDVAIGEVGEIIGHSATMMQAYFGQPDKTAEIEWFAPDGKRFLRSGDLGRWDADGFIELAGRSKEMIISGGFNLYPKDLEEVLMAQPDVAEAAVVGVPSQHWGETPVAFVVLRPASQITAPELLAAVNAQLGRTQRLSDLVLRDSLPRNGLSKVLKNELRAGYQPSDLVGR